MKYLAAAGLVIFLLLSAIRTSRPDYVNTLPTPLPGVTLTFETWSLPLTSDFNRLVVHYDHGGKKDSRFILEGDYVEFHGLLWASHQHLVVCWKSGRVYNFTNEVHLKAGGDTQFFHITLEENCPPAKI